MYYWLRFFVRQGLKIYCGRIDVNDKSILKWKGPLILASNHPNSFFDAIILASLMDQPVHFLALGELTDRFLLQKLINVLHIIPVYQLRDKAGNQERNDKSFADCVDILLNDGIVLIFSEGSCENNWQLRHIKKGTARVTMAALDHTRLENRLRILPVGLNYNSYSQAGKTVLIQFGEPILSKDLPAGKNESEKIRILNELLKEKLSSSVLQTQTRPETAQILISNCPPLRAGIINKLQGFLNEHGEQDIFSELKKPGYFISGNHSLFQSLVLIVFLALPAALGWLSHILIYYPVKLSVKGKTSRSVFFDSVLFTSLFLIYPFYWIGFNLAGYLFFRNGWIQIFLLGMPLLAWTAVYWKESWQRIRNYFMLTVNERSRIANYFN